MNTKNRNFDRKRGPPSVVFIYIFFCFLSSTYFTEGGGGPTASEGWVRTSTNLCITICDFLGVLTAGPPSGSTHDYFTYFFLKKTTTAHDNIGHVMLISLLPSSASYLGIHCLPMYHFRYARCARPENDPPLTRQITDLFKSKKFSSVNIYYINFPVIS